MHETSGGVSTAGHVNGADHRFHGVGQNGGLVRSPGVYLSLSQPDQFSQVKSTGHLGQSVGADHRCAQLGELPLGQVGEGPEDVLGHHDLQHRVAQELQPLVAGDSSVLEGEAAVGEGKLKQLGVHLDTQLIKEGS